MSQVDRALKSVDSYPNNDGKVVRLRGLLWYQVPSLSLYTIKVLVFMTTECFNPLAYPGSCFLGSKTAHDVLWVWCWQGESDTNSTEAVEEFPSKLKSFFTAFW